MVRAQVEVPASPESNLPASEAQAAYGEVVASGVAEFNAHRFAEARELFLHAHELWPSARTFRTLGMTSFELRMYPQALAELQAALDDPRRPLTDDLREHVRGLLEQTRAFVGRYRIRIEPAGAELQVDGLARATENGTVVLTLGEHTLLARAPGRTELRRTLVVQGREDEDIELVLAIDPPVASPPPAAPAAVPAKAVMASASSPPGPNRVPAYIALGVGAAGFIASGVFTGLSLSDKSELEEQCPNRTCPPPYQAQQREMQQFADYATIGFAVGVAGAAAFALLWFTATPPSTEPEHPSEPRAGARPWIGVDGAGIAARF